MDNTKTEKKITIKQLKDLIRFICTDDELKSITTESTRGLRGVKDIVIHTLINLWTAVLLQSGSFPKIPRVTVDLRNVGWSEYVKSLRRCFLLEMWNITENRVREISDEIGLEVKGSQESLKNKINEISKGTKEAETQQKLEAVAAEIRVDFIEFPRVLTQVLKMRCAKDDRQKWEDFFCDFRIIRNTAHNNFILDRDYKPKTSWSDKEFNNGVAINFLPKDMKKVIEETTAFFKMTEDNNSHTSGR